MEWQRPSEHVRELLRQGARSILNTPQPWLDELYEAALSAPRMQVIADDPVLEAGLRRVIQRNLLTWAAANVSDPGEPVAANLAPETLGLARDLARRGLTASALVAYRITQNVTWRRWMSIAFGLTSDAEELRGLLDVSARSLFSFIDATNAAIAAQMQAERDDLSRGTHTERRETADLVLAGAPIAPQHAPSRLGYNLQQTHTAAIIWRDLPESDSTHLDRATEALTRLVRARRPLSVIAAATTRWVWVPATVPTDLGELDRAVEEIRGVRIAVGSTGQGIEGFRRSHFDAIATQRLLTRLRSPRRVANFASVELVALVTENTAGADEFIRRTLGGFESASPEMHTAVRTFLNQRCNASRAAARLFTHRNTLLRHLSRAEQLLPRPLDENSLNVAVALNVLYWRGDSD